MCHMTEVALFYHDMFLPGDVLLTKNKSLTSKVITLAAGEYSHALICTTPPVAIEATISGVKNFSLRNCYVNDINNIKILRLKNSIDTEGEIAKKSGNFAACFLSTLYDVPGAIASVTKKSWSKTSKVFCSKLVAKAYKSAGLELLENIIPDFVTPSMLADSPYFEDITKDMYYISKVNWSPNDREAIDGKRKSNPIRLISEVEKNIFIKTRKIYSDVFFKYTNENPRSLRDIISVFGAVSLRLKYIPFDIKSVDEKLSVVLLSRFSEIKDLLIQGKNITIDSINENLCKTEGNDLDLRVTYENIISNVNNKIKEQEAILEEFKTLRDIGLKTSSVMYDVHDHFINAYKDIIYFLSIST